MTEMSSSTDMKDLCEQCYYNCFDEESGEYICEMQLDEDEYVRLLSDMGKGKSCRYFRFDTGEYGIVRKQN